MKRFEELTYEQKVKSVNYAQKEINELIEMGILLFTKKQTQTEIYDFAHNVAKESFYEDNGEIIRAIFEKEAV